MYYITTYPEDTSKLEMCFNTTNYQAQFPEQVPFEQHVFQTIYLNKGRDHGLWSDSGIREDRIIRRDWWHQLCHSCRTLVNAHEVAVLSGIAAAVDLGAEYPADLENDCFAFLCFRLLAYGKCVYGSVYKGPGVSTVERQTWREELEKGNSTQKLAAGNAPGRSQLAIRGL
ncbi:hypothetical protein MGN70_000662 [Eutypa lata]|nr:hypothetical protein MGN70_000662 [Eutypa lata]